MYSEKYIAIQSKHFSDVGHILLILGMAFIMSFSFSLYFLMEFSQYLKIQFLWDPFKQTVNYQSRCVKELWDIYCFYYGSLAIVKPKCGHLLSFTLLFKKMRIIQFILKFIPPIPSFVWTESSSTAPCNKIPLSFRE